ncbi:Alpha-glucoside transport ATP-binding protein AglK [[Actinomadura] parvosata subsp. kistnae]|uniref:ABC transporter ATP-binding protein n=2 Tax=Nonomuraea TaxID=83681 RepID=A0A1V0A7R3_9ACTN|nr:MULTISPECIES: ABC transporter ATP-binding protein [unclassified Nonomuraea]AQZ66255.1 ABC transporter ATP-binding protein [Nonomuraea sp. ATCC 55076]NJP92077.1 ABC transporter ATP-binding protein [Nonomuraea sp. FMUSA5-5]SPL97775.1 Alpha-glucoside transport ATP-binding protein AglK [Actinomadura parvosata subsp. kistnae]
MSPVVKTVNLVKIYQDGAVPVPAVRGVDLQVEPGEFVAIMGPSGSGKSTLVHMLGGLDARTSGEIWLDGKRVDTLSESAWALLRRKKIGFVFQFFNLVANMTVGDNVELPALLAGASPKVARERRESLLAALNLTDRADAAPAQLSGGEQQRVALARALANEPSLLLADEPTGNLDSRNTRDVLRLLSEVHKQGQTIVMVTHDARVASLADRLVSLFDGEIVDDGRIARRRTRTAGEVIDLR